MIPSTEASSIRLNELVGYLNDYLQIDAVPDYRDAFNGLQVEGKEAVRHIAVAVDACLATIERAVQEQADLLIVHHGLFWGARAPVTGPSYRRLAALIKNDLALYSCHLPLDVHPEVGNNYVLSRQLGLEPGGVFGEFEGAAIGVWADTEITRDELVRRVQGALAVEAQVLATGPAVLRRVGVLTGGGGSEIASAAAAGCDAYLTGEGAHYTYFDAEERGINVLYAGHYATETVGVRALAAHLESRFGLPTLFIDHPTGL